MEKEDRSAGNTLQDCGDMWTQRNPDPHLQPLTSVQWKTLEFGFKQDRMKQTREDHDCRRSSTVSFYSTWWFLQPRCLAFNQGKIQSRAHTLSVWRFDPTVKTHQCCPTRLHCSEHAGIHNSGLWHRFLTAFPPLLWRTKPAKIKVKIKNINITVFICYTPTRLLDQACVFKTL